LSPLHDALLSVNMVAIDLSSAAASWQQMMSALDASVDLVTVRGAIPPLLQIADPGIVARCPNGYASLRAATDPYRRARPSWSSG
jgi:hypothetical protein